jgi:hypothetical protein
MPISIARSPISGDRPVVSKSNIITVSALVKVLLPYKIMPYKRMSYLNLKKWNSIQVTSISTVSTGNNFMSK